MKEAQAVMPSGIQQELLDEQLFTGFPETLTDKPHGA